MNSPLFLNNWVRQHGGEIAVCVASGFYLSYLPPIVAEKLKKFPQLRPFVKHGWTGSGLAGSFWGLLTYLLLPRSILTSYGPAFLLIILFTVLAVWVAHHAEKVYMVKDDSRIVIDEWIGTVIAMIGFRPNLGVKLIVAFILFRIFDVYKGPWNKKLQNLPGGWGVVMDDVAAGIMANICIRLGVVIGLIN